MTTPLDAPLDWASIVGLCGTACIIGAYAYLTLAKQTNPFLLHGTNLTGAALLTVSLLVHTNWASLVLEGFWAAIAIFGLVRAWRASASEGEQR
ncbi:permease [Erythrobacter sp.]|uniref:CBU_0592 family membrane protein n=1 Tax=Erythrobacter sp. TaxID=1042 RepID=UPI0025E824C5|nr:permease [Erythrobacter sp.]